MFRAIYFKRHWANATATVTVSGLTVNNTLESERVGGYWFKQLSVGNNSAQIVNVNVTANIGGNFAYSDGQVFARAHPENFTHDDDGNLLTDGKWDYTWDGENRLVKAEASSAAQAGGLPNVAYHFTYDSLGRCVRKLMTVGVNTEEDTLFVYDGWEMIVERYNPGYPNPVRKTLCRVGEKSRVRIRNAPRKNRRRAACLAHTVRRG